MVKYQHGSFDKIQNLSSIPVKLCMLGQKTGTLAVNTTIGSLYILSLLN